MALIGEIGCFANVAVFPEDRWRDVFLFRPNIIATDADMLVKLAEYVFHGVWAAPPVDTASFVLTRLGHEPFGAEERSLVWRAFRIPLYELLVDADEGVLAAECAAHEGWHLVHPQLRFELQTGRVLFQKHGLSASPVPTGLVADGLDGMCCCGKDAPLLRNVRRQETEKPLVKTVGA